MTSRTPSAHGVDYAWGRPGVDALNARGLGFVARYLSPDHTGKNLTPSEARELIAAGLSIVCVWESSENRALGGRAAGESDARAAARQAQICGMPADRPIYFAVDFDAQIVDQPKINEYLRGAGAVLGHSRVGIYGGYGPVARAAAAGVAAWTWQTYAWSNGRWMGAHIEQYRNDVVINGVGCDLNRAYGTDYGQWPVTGDDMPKPSDLWSYPINVPDYAQDDHPGVTSMPAGAWLRGTEHQVHAARADVAALRAEVDEVKAILGQVLAAVQPKT